jgi:hypothetical protein
MKPEIGSLKTLPCLLVRPSPDTTHAHPSYTLVARCRYLKPPLEHLVHRGGRSAVCVPRRSSRCQPSACTPRSFSLGGNVLPELIGLPL